MTIRALHAGYQSRSSKSFDSDELLDLPVKKARISIVFCRSFTPVSHRLFLKVRELGVEGMSTCLNITISSS
jgi:hypothetical protein